MALRGFKNPTPVYWPVETEAMLLYDGSVSCIAAPMYRYAQRAVQILRLYRVGAYIGKMFVACCCLTRGGRVAAVTLLARVVAAVPDGWLHCPLWCVMVPHILTLLNIWFHTVLLPSMPVSHMCQQARVLVRPFGAVPCRTGCPGVITI